MKTYFDFSPEVEQALKQQKPVLALESTVITHGLPFPQNVETARALEAIVRAEQVTPATIAILDGRIKIGLTDMDLTRLIECEQKYKASKCDIPYLLSKNLTAGTTVAATLFCAHSAGIRVFATGGIGGVHHGDSLDISADLIELAHTPVAVVCAGAKSILDLPRTLEFLETHSVPVVGYRTKTLPAFYTSKTPHHLTQYVEDVPTLAKLLKIHWELQMRAGILVTNPIPEADEIPADIMEPVIQESLSTAIRNNLAGKEVTPFLLSEIAEMTKGKSIKANISLIKNNVRLGALLAKELMN
jgi:pseudouridine-5'-phosphate glycosidase